MGENQLHMQIFPEKEGKLKKTAFYYKGPRTWTDKAFAWQGRKAKRQKNPRRLLRRGLTEINLAESGIGGKGIISGILV